MSTLFHQEGKVEIERKRQVSLQKQSAKLETHVFKITLGIPSGPYSFLMLGSERIKITSLIKRKILGVNVLEEEEEEEGEELRNRQRLNKRIHLYSSV